MSTSSSRSGSFSQHNHNSTTTNTINSRTNCNSNLGIRVCYRCKQVLSTTDKACIIANNYFHTSCFYCVECKISIVGKEFYTVNGLDNTLCKNCFVNKRASGKRVVGDRSKSSSLESLGHQNQNVSGQDNSYGNRINTSSTSMVKSNSFSNNSPIKNKSYLSSSNTITGNVNQNLVKHKSKNSYGLGLGFQDASVRVLIFRDMDSGQIYPKPTPIMESITVA